MSGFSFSHLSGLQVLADYSKAKASNRASDALVLAYLGEIDARKLFLEAAHESMYAFVAAEFDFTHDIIKKRIHAARTAHQFPQAFPMLSDGRLSMSTFLMLVPYLNRGEADGLLSVAENKTRSQLESILAARHPTTELMDWTMAPTSPQQSTVPEQTHSQGAPGHLESRVSNESCDVSHSSPTACSEREPANSSLAPAAHVAPATRTPAAPATRVSPIAAHAYGAQFMMDEEAHDDLEYLRAVLGPEAPSVAKVFALALKALRREVDKRKFRMTSRPGKPRRSQSMNPRHIPAHVRRAVQVRDHFRCTFVGANGKRCDARAGLQFDHVKPVAQGGESTVDNLRLLCHAHNQHAADRTFGVEFMDEKRSHRQRIPADGGRTQVSRSSLSPPGAAS